jgi:crotonobetainyl-CoA:carnitine CoA-transferase CaiB-like acyl-CoA transferase
MYDLLSGIRVLEVSFLAPDALGGHLADLGAEVIKIEEPPDGSRIRWPGAPLWRVLHWRWNRGKKSVFLDLKSAEGRDTFLQLARTADVVVDGLRAGAMSRLGLSYDAVKALNPGIVYCSLSGLGQDGPYRDMPTHGWAFDALAGLGRPVIAPDGTPRLPAERASLVGIQAGPLYAAVGILAALLRQRSTGQGTYLDVAEVDAAIVWRANVVDALANGVVAPNMAERLRYQFYATSDDQYVMFMALEEKFWRNFCEGAGRPDLLEHPGADQTGSSDDIEQLRRELTVIFRSRTRADWVAFFIEYDVAGAPVYLGLDILDDPHVAAHNLVFDQQQADGSALRLLGTPIRMAGSTFEPTPAPAAGEHTQEILDAAVTSADAAGRSTR